jgi:uncharacterized protein (TIGR02453 family)
MRHLTPEFKLFLKQLSKNNSTEWFHKNKSSYEEVVKKPFEKLVTKLIEKIQTLDPSVMIGYKEAIVRINKDIRFSKDKIPYNTYVGAVISSAGKKDKSIPGMYLQISEKEIQLFFGCYVLESQVMQNVRGYMASNLTTFNKLLDDASFKKYFTTLRGEPSKRIPDVFKEAVNKQPLIANKQFLMQAVLDEKTITSEKLEDTIVAHYKAAMKMNSFLKNAMEGYTLKKKI